MNHLTLEHLLNDTLNINAIKDYCPNGLQVEGKAEVNHIVTGVTASQGLIEAAIDLKADAILVHHGYFWKGEPESIRGMKGKRIRTLMRHDLNLYAYHLPLDIHPELGNNAQLAQLLDLKTIGGMAPHPQSVAMYGELPEPMSGEAFAEKIARALHRTPLHIPPENRGKPVQRLGWCTGGGQDYINLAAEMNLDAFISGEISERTTYSAREQDIHYFAAGHHATERGGVKALGEWLASEYELQVSFVDIDNPV